MLVECLKLLSMRIFVNLLSEFDSNKNGYSFLFNGDDGFYWLCLVVLLKFSFCLEKSVECMVFLLFFKMYVSLGLIICILFVKERMENPVLEFL